MVPDVSSSLTPESDGVRPGGIPEQPVGTPVFGQKSSDADEGRPVGPTPPRLLAGALRRRSVRKFKPDPVPRELVQQVMHAGIWAPSSCNYQMWDLVAVDDAETNAKLAALSSRWATRRSTSSSRYGRDFSEEQWANIQSASALIQNMSLAAHVLGLGTFWITQMGDREKVREVVGLPSIAWSSPCSRSAGPRSCRSGAQAPPARAVAHWNHYAGRAIPSSAPTPSAGRPS